MYSYQGMPVTTSHVDSTDDWLESISSMSDRVAISSVGKIVAIRTDTDTEFGNPAWVFRFELQLEDGRAIKLTKNNLCMGSNPVGDLRRSFRNAERAAKRKLAELGA